MAVWIECPKCGVESRNQPGRTRCPECGTRIQFDEDRDESDVEPRRRKKKKSKKMKPVMLYSLIGVGVLALILVVVLILLIFGGKRAEPANVTMSNFWKVEYEMAREEVETILGGSYSSSLDDMQRELTKAVGAEQAKIRDNNFERVLRNLGTWRRWDGPGLKIWAIFTSTSAGEEVVVFFVSLEALPNGQYLRHQGAKSFNR